MPDQPETPLPDEFPEPTPPPPKSAPTDWRLIAIVAVALLFLAAVFINKKFYSKKLPPPPPTAQPQVNTPAEPPAAFPSMAERYAAMIHNRELEAKDCLYQVDGSVMLLAQPPRAEAEGDDPRKIKDIAPGRMLDVTHRVEGLRPEQLFRRSLFGNNRPIFMDSFPALGLSPDLKMMFRAAADATIDVISDQQRVVGVVVGGEARAYPVKMMNYHEVINDTVGGVPIVVTWSAISQCATAWERALPDKSVATFGSAGLLYQSAIVMYDQESHSLWWTVRGQALTGPRAGETPLTPVQATVAGWKAWKQFAPQSSVLTGTEPVLPIDYELNPAVPQGYLNDNALVYPVYGFDVEKQSLFPKEPVLVVTGPDGKRVKAYVAQLLAQKSASGPVEDAIGGEKVTLQFDKDAMFLKAQTMDGKPLLVRAMYWIACVGAYPDAELWEEETIRQDAGAAGKTGE